MKPIINCVRKGHDVHVRSRQHDSPDTAFASRVINMCIEFQQTNLPQRVDYDQCTGAVSNDRDGIDVTLFGSRDFSRTNSGISS